MPEYTIDIVAHLTPCIVEHDFLTRVIERVLIEEQVNAATISVALVSDAEIHELNRRYLGHDYPTDVISFLLNEPAEDEELGKTPGHDSEHSVEDADATSIAPMSSFTLDGELIVSVETANREAAAQGWSPEAELLLYVVHGLLHLCGYDDLTDEERPVMRSRERDLLAIWGFCPSGLES